MSRTVVFGIILLFIGVGLWILSQKKVIKNDTLDTIEKIGSIVAVLAAIVLIMNPSLGSNDPSGNSNGNTTSQSISTTIASNTDYYFEDFSEDNGNWPTGNSEYDWGVAESVINDGKFHWEAQVDTDEFFHLPMPPLPDVSNFEFEVDFSLIEGLRQYGLTFRGEGDSFYYFPIDHGNFAFTRWENETGNWKLEPHSFIHFVF
ncbi:MAG: hypothetical protein DHS20C20_01610 [Ardenticatenaceae bacterium]|nr:MAG: hypothetical protein DHS20C20_01610 [Ardenticatenaceae bacterium]